MQKILIHTDGGSRGNPGPAGAGAVIEDEAGNVLATVSEFLGIRTNNWAEYQAVIRALETTKKLLGEKKARDMEVEVRLDSQLIARQLSGQYQIKEESLFAQFIKAHNLRVAAFPHLTYIHVPREQNKVADRLANEAMDKGTSL